jgi:beta-lactam-binding protein with PASTA domain
VAHSMLKQPEQRYGSADEFSADLDRVRRGLVPAAATALIEMPPREPTEQVPAVEATRIAPRAEAPSLLSDEKLPPRPVPRKRSRWPWLLVLLLVLAVGALAAFALGVGGDDGGKTTPTTGTTTQQTTAVAAKKLEDLDGKSYQEAKAALAGYGLDLDVRRQRVRNNDAEAEVVVETVPPADSELQKGDTVLLKVSRGQKEVPNIVDANLADALQQLGSDFKVVKKSEASDTVDKGKITQTDPPPGERIPVGSTVTISVSTGAAQVQVPRLAGRTEDEARATLGSAGLLVKEPPGSRCSDDVEVGQVAKQTPQVGTLVKRNTAVSFDVASSPCTVDVPSVRNLPVAQAVQNLEAATIATRNIVVVNQTVTDPAQDGVVLDQDIEGTNAKPFKVTITVGRLDPTVTTTTP